jgi:hypothetical protein
MRYQNRMQRPFKLLHPESKEALELGELWEEIVILPNVGLQEPRMVRPPIKNLRSREPVACQLPFEILGRHFESPSSPIPIFLPPTGDTSSKFEICS